MDFVAAFFEKIFAPIALTAEEISVERNRIRAEIWESQGANDTKRLAESLVWAGTPLEKPILGTYSSIVKIRKKQLENLRREVFSPNNMFVYLTGAVPDAFLQKICSALEKQDFSKSEWVRGNVVPIPQNFQNRSCTVCARRDPYPAMRLCFDIDCQKTTRAERNLLYKILFSGTACAFYRKLSEEKGLIYSHDAYLEGYRNIGNMCVFLEYEKADFLTLLREIVAIFQQIKAGVFDLECAKAEYTLGLDLLLDDVSDLNWSLAYDSKFLGVPYSLEESAGVYASVTKERISEIAADIFTTDNLVLVVRGNSGEKEIKSAREILAELDASVFS